MWQILILYNTSNEIIVSFHAFSFLALIHKITVNLKRQFNFEDTEVATESEHEYLFWIQNAFLAFKKVIKLASV